MHRCWDRRNDYLNHFSVSPVGVQRPAKEVVCNLDPRRPEDRLGFDARRPRGDVSTFNAYDLDGTNQSTANRPHPWIGLFVTPALAEI
jgi:hypothetical protein